jgi:hypothetical protein
VPDPDPLDLLRDSLGALPGPESRTPDCLDDETVAALAGGTVDAAARARALAHLAVCPRCRHAVASVARALADPAVSREIARADTAGGRRNVRAPARRGWPRWRRWSLPLGLATAAAVALLLVPRRGDDGSMPGLRDTTLTAAGAPVPVGPRASVARVNRFVWSGVPRATQYHLRLYDAEGAVLWTLETSDTVVALPDSVKLVPGVTYFWKVEAQTDWQRWAASELVEFRVAGGSR